MIRNNIIDSIIHIKFNNNSGTGFAVVINDCHYIITANHIVKGMDIGGEIEYYQNNEWNRMRVNVAPIKYYEMDIAVLIPDRLIREPLKLNIGANGIALSQDVYFVGFPYGMMGELSPKKDGFPLPLIKKGILSTLLTEKKGKLTLIIDGFNNPGFSGGPVVYKHLRNNNLNIASVISGYQQEEKKILFNEKETELKYIQNTGIIITYGLDSIKEELCQNPCGFIQKQ
ncbi:MAG: hypothetical protein GF329_15775 [Candidatus Lokiarchaeota archaeon]|nr:hypothetical protein [Candidatus Lokiarchaeota archaeon]